MLSVEAGSPSLFKMSGGSDTGVQPSRGNLLSRFSPISVVYWSRLGFAVLAGLVYTALGLGQAGVGVGTVYAIGLGVLLYAVSVLLVKYVLGYGSAQLSGPRKHVSLGMGSYIIWLIFTITLLNTLFYPPL